MNPTCSIYRTMQKIRSGSHCNVCNIGGSLTVGIGASNTAVTSWRKLFIEYLYERFHPVYQCQPGEILACFGAMESYGGLSMINRLVAPLHPDLCFIEFCVNDGGQPDKELVKKGVEGIVRQLKMLKTSPDIVFVGAGIRPDPNQPDKPPVDHSLHREIAAYYGLDFIDIQDSVMKKLAERKQTWQDIAILFQENDGYHVNDYGNRLWFECIQEWFEEQNKQFSLNPSTSYDKSPLKLALFYDEFQNTFTVDPSKQSKNLTLEGTWEKKSKGAVPWYFDNLLVGRPGDVCTLKFTGTAIGIWCFVHSNGLKMEATIDGKEIAGPFTNFTIHFGKYFMLAHGLENTEHTLQLKVSDPWKKTNRLEDPTAEIGFFCIAGKSE